ncbi:hypothetical protein LL912_19225 [Niabella sp. CC-SYL272]|uniref:hypothetical protein n=1 Tax=Niabella agricola TaxID=2891571 RepID=UPI001F2DB917|nr:hypothetical protein [Niabella agricola]MCF3110926.1 hypothetical protein [Niabella agricola]
MKKWTHPLYTGLIAFAGLALLLTACKKNPVTEQEESKVIVVPAVQPKGTSTGAAVTKTIGPAGGSLQSANGELTITIPQGALSAETLIGMEPVTNTNLAGIGGAYRLTPHGQQFAKPVTLTCSWAAHADSAGLLQTLGMAFQEDNGIWKFVGASSSNLAQKTVSFNTMHFSDWSMMNRISLAPYYAELEMGQKQTIKALVFTDIITDDLLAPLSNDPNGPYYDRGYPVGNPVPLPSKFIKSWELNGPGKITNASSGTIEYQAPQSVNGTATATVTLELNAPVTGKFMLLSTLKISSDEWIELSIGGGAVTRFPGMAIKAGNSYMLSNEEDEGGGYFLLTWPGGVGSYTWDLEAQGTHFHFQTPQTTYMSRYIDDKNSPLKPSGGNVTITKLANGRVEGSFTVTNAGYGPTLMQKTSAQGRFKTKVFIP